MSKTVLHVLNTGSYSGAENVAITIIESFRKFGFDDFDFVYVSLEGSIKDVLNEKNIRFEPLKNMSLREVRRVIRKYCPDIIHAHDFTASIMCAVVSGKIPVISHIHNNSPWIKKYCVNSFVYGLSCLKYKYILGVSNSVFDEYVFGKYIQNKAMVIGNPVDINKIREKADVAEDKSSYDVVFLGRLAEPKNPLGFVDIIEKVSERIPDITAVMIGSGELESEVLNRIYKKRLNKNITMKGFMNNPYGILKASKILCMPSKWEGYGLAAVEAMVLNTYVIASNTGGLVDIVKYPNGEIYNDKEECVKKIVDILYDYNGKKQYFATTEKGIMNLKKYIYSLRDIYSNI